MLNDTIIWFYDVDTLELSIQSKASNFFNSKPNIRLELKKLNNYKVVLLCNSYESHLHIGNNVSINSKYSN